MRHSSRLVSSERLVSQGNSWSKLLQSSTPPEVAHDSPTEELNAQAAAVNTRGGHSKNNMDDEVGR